MRFLVFLLALLIPTFPGATDFDSPQESGPVEVRGQAAAAVLRSGNVDTAILGLFRTDTSEQLFCADAGPGAIVGGVTSPITNTGGPIFLEFFAFELSGCQGQQSVASADRYRVIFGAPGQPILLQLIPAGP